MKQNKWQKYVEYPIVGLLIILPIVALFVVITSPFAGFMPWSNQFNVGDWGLWGVSLVVAISLVYFLSYRFGKVLLGGKG